MTDIYYVLNSRFPTIKAYGLQVAKTCEGLKRSGARVRLIVPFRKRHREIFGIPAFDLYSVRDKFRIVHLPSLDFAWLGFNTKLFFAIQQVTFASIISLYLIFKDGIIYSRDQFSLYFLSFFKKHLYWEVHRFPENIHTPFYRRLVHRVDGIVVITKHLKDAFIRTGMHPNKILIAPDGIDLEEFMISESPDEARTQLALPSDAKIVLYVGHLFEYKGADILVQAAQKLPDNLRVVIVGGTDEDIARLKKLDVASVVRFEGYKPHTEIPLYLRAADILILPNKKDSGVSEFYTSPLKLFEYMAAKKPIIASNLASLREVIDENTAVLVESNNPRALADAINDVSSRYENFVVRADNAFRAVHEYTWAKRGAMIIQFIHGISH